MQWCIVAAWCMYLWALGIADIKSKSVSKSALIYGMVLLLLSIYGYSLDGKHLLSGGILGAVFILVSRYTKEALGYGDSMVLTMVSVWLGGYLAIYTIGAAFAMVAIYGVVRKSKELPFIPFLAASYTLSIFLC